MARKGSRTSSADSGIKWMSRNFSEPRRRSWPGEATALEVLATRAGISDEELRALLEDEIQRRLRARATSQAMVDAALEKRARRNGH